MKNTKFLRKMLDQNKNGFVAIRDHLISTELVEAICVEMLV